MRLYNVCRAKTEWSDHRNKACSCGLAFPAKMWHRPDKGMWKWICQVDWMPLLEEQEKHPTYPQLKTWVEDIQKKCGEDVTSWPELGCKSNFVPWAKGRPWWWIPSLSLIHI